MVTMTADTNETSEYKELFISEAQEILAQLNSELVELEKKPDDAQILNEVFRQSHTLKGMAATMGYEVIVKITHRMESVLNLLRGNAANIDKHAICVLFTAIDVLDNLIEGVKNGSHEDMNGENIVNELDQLTIIPTKKKKCKNPKLIVKLRDQEKLAIAEAAKRGVPSYLVEVAISKDSQMRKVRAAVVVRALEELGEIVRSDYVFEQIKNDDSNKFPELIFLTTRDPSEVMAKIELMPEIDKISLCPLTADNTTQYNGKACGKAASPLLAQSIDYSTIRVDINKLDNLMDIVGELVIYNSRALDLSQSMENNKLDEAIMQTKGLISQLQVKVMEVRLLPLGYIFNRFPRMTRDLARELNKEVDLVVNGADIGLDRTIIDEINKPLIHILRNAITHGIEPSEERQRLGKPRRGKLMLSASRERNFVLIEASDDGRGIDTERVRQVAIEKEIISSEEAAVLSDEETAMLITASGLSVAKEVSEKAGRGIGMNVAKTMVEAIGGSIRIESELGQGSKFTLKLPLSVAITQSLLVGVSGNKYCIPLMNIIETIKIDPKEIKVIEHSEMISYRGTVLPLVRASERLGHAAKQGARRTREHGYEIIDKMPNSIPVVVVEAGPNKVGIIVDSFLGQKEVVIKTLQHSLKKVRGIAGATVLGDGKVAMIIDLPSLLSQQQKEVVGVCSRQGENDD